MDIKRILVIIPNMKSLLKRYLIGIQILFFVIASQSFAEDAHVTLWVKGLGLDNPTRVSTLKIEANETAYLVSWRQDEFQASFMEIWSGSRSVTITRNPEFEVDQKNKTVKKHGILPLPDLVVAGPATIEIKKLDYATIFCTFRIVKGSSRVIVDENED